jgi:hypothetical protein
LLKRSFRPFCSQAVRENWVKQQVGSVAAPQLSLVRKQKSDCSLNSRFFTFNHPSNNQEDDGDRLEQWLK